MAKNFDFKCFSTKRDYIRFLLQQGKISSWSEGDKAVRERIPKEHFFQKLILDSLRKEFPDGRWRKVASSQDQNAGEPDLDGVLYGMYIAIEVKRPLLGTASQLQLKAINEINHAGGLAMVASYPDEVIEKIHQKLDANGL